MILDESNQLKRLCNLKSMILFCFNIWSRFMEWPKKYDTFINLVKSQYNKNNKLELPKYGTFL